MAGDRAAQHRLVAPLLFFLAIIIVAALASNLANLVEPLPALPRAPDQSAPTQGFLPGPTLAFLLWAFVLGVIAVLLVGVRSVRRPRKVPRAPTGWDLIGLVISTAVMVAVLLAWRSLMTSIRQLVASANPAGGGTNETTALGPWQGISALPLIVVAFAITAAALAVVVLSRATVERDPAGETPPRHDFAGREGLALAVRQTLDDLGSGRDPRASILRCYAALCALLRRRGLEDLSPLTPREVQRRALGQFGISPGDIDTITTAFEEARYSVHPIGPAMRDGALVAFSHVRVALEA